MLGNAVDSKFCVLLDNECVSSDESQLTVVEEERPLYIAKPTSDASQCSSTGVVKSSFVEKIERRVQTCLNVSEGIKLNRRCLKASECRESLVLEDSLQRREQICPNISEIIEDEKRYCVQIIIQFVTSDLVMFLSQAESHPLSSWELFPTLSFPPNALAISIKHPTCICAD